VQDTRRSDSKNAAFEKTYANAVWAWLGTLPTSVQDAILQDLPRWLTDHSNVAQERHPGFLEFWSSRQDFRSLIRYRTKMHDRSSAPGLSIALNKITGVKSWLYVQNLYIQCKEIGPGLYIQHGFSSIVYARKIGKNFHVNQNVTIGAAGEGIPTIGDNCFVHCNAVVIGGITLGDNVRVGAGAVVTEDIPSNCTVVPQKPRIIQRAE